MRSAFEEFAYRLFLEIEFFDSRGRRQLLLSGFRNWRPIGRLFCFLVQTAFETKSGCNCGPGQQYTAQGKARQAEMLLANGLTEKRTNEGETNGVTRITSCNSRAKAPSNRGSYCPFYLQQLNKGLIT